MLRNVVVLENEDSDNKKPNHRRLREESGRAIGDHLE